VRHDREGALRDLRLGRVDLVAVAPTDPLTTLKSNKRAQFGVYHNEIDPVQANYVSFLWDFVINEINRSLLEDVIRETQRQAGEFQPLLSGAQKNAALLRTSLERGDVESARSAYAGLAPSVSRVDSSVSPTLSMLDRISAALNSRPGAAGSSEAQAARARLDELKQDVAALEGLKPGAASYEDEAKVAARIETRLGALQGALTLFQTLSPDTIVRPLESSSESVSPVRLNVTSYFAPAVIVLLLQHLLVTMAALSFVRERMLGAVELFRASPLSALEILIGKYASYMLIGSMLAVMLTLALLLLLGVPMLGSWTMLAAVIGALMFASIGYGMLISILADNDSQAVQYAMLLLLGAVFFSGAFVALYNIRMPSQIVSWLLPATYGVQALQSVMLRGAAPDNLIYWGLIGMGVVLFGVNWALLTRKMANE
jgi:ABC-2 type transport system permease protein